MSQLISLGVDFSERSLRYAVLGRGRVGDRLLKLGRVDFSFDLAVALVEESAEAERETVSRALVEGVGNLQPTVLRAALHAPLGRSFFSRAVPGDEVAANARYEAGLLGYCREGDDAVVSTDVVWSRAGLNRVHVSVTPGIVLELLAHVIDPVGCREAQAVSALRAAAEIFRRLPWDTDLARSRVLAVGRFDRVTELLVLDAQGWRFGVQMPPTDGFPTRRSSVLLEAAGESGLDAVITYGEPIPADVLLELRSDRAEALDPLELVGYDPKGLRPDEWPGRFAAALGAAMLQ